MLKSGLKRGTFEYASSNPILDRVDRVPSRYYGFTNEELDSIVNYDIKYRMGQDSSEGEEE